MEKRLLGRKSGKLLAFPLGDVKPREGTCLAQGHTAGIFMPLLPQALPLWHQMDPKLSFRFRWKLHGEFREVGREQTGGQTADTPTSFIDRAPCPTPWQCPLEGQTVPRLG